MQGPATETAHRADGYPREWWQVLADQAGQWADSHASLVTRLRQVRTLGTWLGLLLVLLLFAFRPELRAGLRLWVALYWLLALWFLLARTRTITWRLMATTFALSVPWSAFIGAFSLWLTHRLGLGSGDPGPGVMIAGITEESFKLVPLAVVAVLAPQRCRRFAVVDWLLLGLASGLAFQAIEELARRIVVARQRPSLFDVLLGNGTGAGSGYAQYGFSPLSGGSSTPTASFAGHHVLTALTGLAVGLGIAMWRHGVRVGAPGWRVAAVTLPVLSWWTCVVDHVGNNASVGSRSWVQTAHQVPWLFRVWWDHGGHGTHRGTWLLLGLLVAMVVDARRLRHAERIAAGVAGSGLLPAMPWRPAAIGARWVAPLRRAQRGLPHGLHPAFLAVARSAVSAVEAAAVLVAYAGRDVAGMLVAGAREVGESARDAAGRAYVAGRLLREDREAAMHACAPAGDAEATRVRRLVAAGALAALLFCGAVVAGVLAAHVGASLTTPSGGWLAGRLDELATWWDGLSPSGKLLVTVGLAALIALSGGSFAVALGVAGTATWVAEHGHGEADFLRDPRKATQSFFTNLTPQQVLGYALEIALARVLPAGAGALGGRMSRMLAEDYARDPAAMRALMRAARRDESGAIDLESLAEALADATNRYGYRRNFFLAHPDLAPLADQLIIHHAVEQQAMKLYPGLYTRAELHAAENLRGIPKAVNSDLHLRRIRAFWTRFYKEFPDATREQIDSQVKRADSLFGTEFNPPITGE